MRALLASLLLASSAHASLLDGQPVTLEHLFPTVSSLNEMLADGVIVGPGIEGQTFDSLYSVDVADDTITVRQLQGVNWSLAPFNGLHLYAPGVTFTGAATVWNPCVELFQHWDVDPNRVSFDAHDLWLNFAGLSVLQGEELTILLNPVLSIPEPTTLALVLAGLAVIAARRPANRG